LNEISAPKPPAWQGFKVLAVEPNIDTVALLASAHTANKSPATTLVLTHNWLGRVYLAIILPFHRRIVRALLRKLQLEVNASAEPPGRAGSGRFPRC
jgi:hypothetical protein